MPEGIPVFEWSLKARRTAWTGLPDDAACRDEDRELFFPPSDGPRRTLGDDAQPALAICGRCPIQSRCLAYALDNGEHGIWGGTGTHERYLIRKRAKRREAS